MKYKSWVYGTFVERPNRFVAHVNVDNTLETVHVKNTGRCKELLLPYSRVVLSRGEGNKRKTRFDLVAVWKEELGWVNIDSQLPNYAVREWLETKPTMFSDITSIRSEYVFGDSRIDFFLASEDRKVLLEVKGCTLEKEGIGYFPDAPTLRGVKHLHELIRGVEQGYECYIAFVIAMPGVQEVFPNKETHPAFSEALQQAMEKGVRVLFLPCDVSEEELYVKGVIEKKEIYF